MTSDMNSLSAVIVSLALTYLLHSTIFLVVTWVVVAALRDKSLALCERVWKFAAVAGLVTAAMQVTFGFSTNAVNISLTSNPAPVDVQSVGEVALPPIHQEISAGDDSNAESLAGNRSRSIEDPSHAARQDPTAPTRPRSDSTQTWNEQDNASPRRVVIHDESVESTIALPTNDAQHETVNAQRGSSNHRVVDDDRSSSATEILQGSQDLDGVTSSFGLSFVAASFAVAVIFGVLRMMVQDLMFRRRMALATRVQSDSANRVLQRLIQRNDLRRDVRLLSSSQFSEPVAFGLWRWTIVLPAGLETQLSKEELRALLAHELAHLTRGDVWWLWVGRVICSCFAIQPLNFLARNRWQQAAEYLCDDWAVNNGASGLSLARCLTQIAQWRLKSIDRELALAAGGPKKTLVRRVERLVSMTDRDDRWERGLRRRILTLASVALIGLFSFTVPRLGFTAVESERFATTSIESNLMLDSDQTDASIRKTIDLMDELHNLDAELQHADKLLQRFPSDPDIQALAEQLRKRATQIRIHSRTELVE